MKIPELEAHCGSWIIVERVTFKPVIELFVRSNVELVNQEKYIIYTTLQWLRLFNVMTKINTTLNDAAPR